MGWPGFSSLGVLSADREYDTSTLQTYAACYTRIYKPGRLALSLNTWPCPFQNMTNRFHSSMTNMSYSPPDSAKPFTLNISDQDLSEWRQLLQLSRLPPDTWEGRQEDRRFGVTRKWLSETKDYWLNQYDWRAAERHINSFPNYKMQIQDVDLHFVALFSEKKDAIPIILMHGWPGSFIEFLPILSILKKSIRPRICRTTSWCRRCLATLLARYNLTISSGTSRIPVVS